MNVHLVADGAEAVALREAINEIAGCCVSLASPLEDGARDVVAVRPEAVVVALRDGDTLGPQVLRALRTIVPRPISIALVERDTPEARAAAKRSGADYCFDRTRALSPFKETLEILAMAKGVMAAAGPAYHRAPQATRHPA